MGDQVIILRPVRPEDTAELLEIYRPYVESTSISFETEVPSQEDFARRIADITAEYPYLVAEESGVILGYAYAHAFSSRDAYRWTAETTIYLRQDAQGQHVGGRLYRVLLALLRAQGVRTACAIVTASNERSLRFHNALGFVSGGVLPDFGYKLGQWHSVAYLYLPLGPAEPLPEEPVGIAALAPERIAAILAEPAGIS